MSNDMREILFRGKRKDNGEWVEGAYYKQTHFYGDPCEKHFIITSTEDLGYDYALDYYEVIPETVGQFTVLTDKNGKKIFEGDIVEGHCHSQWSHRLQRCVVEYSRDGFEARHYVKQGEVMRYYSYKVLFSKNVVVIGNIHDNPELLNKLESESNAE